MYKTIQRLIDIYWRPELTNKQVIEETYKFSLKQFEFPHSLQKYLELMKANQGQQVTHPFLIIEPYGDALEKLEPNYFTKRRTMFYQETPDKDGLSTLI